MAEERLVMAERQCRWCSEPATTVREVVPADVNARTKEIRSPAIEADVCDEHAAMIDRNIRRVELENAIRRLNARMARSEPHTSRRAVIVRELGAARVELAELNS